MDLRRVTADPDDEVAAAALHGLGGLGSVDDAPLLSAALLDVRRAAGNVDSLAVGLARL